MTTDQFVPPVTQHQDPPPSPRKWSARRTTAAVGIAAALAVAGGVTIYATSGSDSGTTTSQGPGGGAPPGGAGGPMGATTALHGTYTVADDSGSGYHTELTQTGSVTAISATSVTIASADDYTKTYVIDSGTVVRSTSAGGQNATAAISSITKGDKVTVTAEASGATVDTITEQG